MINLYKDGKLISRDYAEGEEATKPDLIGDYKKELADIESGRGKSNSKAILAGSVGIPVGAAVMTGVNEKIHLFKNPVTAAATGALLGAIPSAIYATNTDSKIKESGKKFLKKVKESDNCTSKDNSSFDSLI